jgi:uridine kinase
MASRAPDSRVSIDRNDPPVIVGIAGGTGSGKTTLARRIQQGVGEQSCLVQHDWYYVDMSHLPPEERADKNFDHPKSLENDLLVEHLECLHRGEGVEVPQYDYANHVRKDESRHIEPQSVIIVEGILLFAVPDLRESFDIRIYVDTDSDIRAFRRIRRDINERDRSFEEVRKQYYETVRPMHLEFVEPSKRWADVIVPEGGKNDIALEMINERLRSFLDS